MVSSHNKLHSAERILPALLDRLSDDEPGRRSDVRGSGAFNKTQFRRCVLRDLGWLLNAANAESDINFSSSPEACQSVINFGLPALSGKKISDMDWHALEKDLHKAILSFEPRLLPEALEVRARTDQLDGEHHNRIFFEIRGQLWCEPYPLELLLRSQIDLESGQVVLSDMAGGG